RRRARWPEEPGGWSARPDRFSRGDSPGPVPGSGGRRRLDSLIDSSFCTMYSCPSKPPVFGDLAGFRRRLWRQGTGKLSAVEPFIGRLPDCSPLLTQRGSAATLRGEMGLSPFASTVGSTSNPASDSAVPRGNHIQLPCSTHIQTFVACSNRLLRRSTAGGSRSTGERGPPPGA